MKQKQKSEFCDYTSMPNDNFASASTDGLGIEFVHFDSDDKAETIQTIPLGKFISESPLSSDEYFMTRTLVTAQAAK